MFSCSQQSIFSAMDRFVKAVSNMDATVLVPSKLRDMDISSSSSNNSSNSGINGNGSSSTGHCKRMSGHRRVPPALANTPDLYSFYLMLNEVKKELLWGPGTGAVAAATMGSSSCTPNSANNQPVSSAISTASGLVLAGLAVSSGRSSPRECGNNGSSGGGGGTTNGSIVTSSNNVSSCLLHHSTHSTSSSSSSFASSLITSSSICSSHHNNHCHSNGIMNGCSTKQHSRQPSDDSLGSLGSSTVSSSEQDTDSEVDSLLTDRDSVGDEHTSHLAAAFRHHLQGLHTILHQLADSADYLSSRYQEEIDASSL